MKSLRTLPLLAALTLLPALAQAHPGHSGVDWFSAPPHVGHEGEYIAWVAAVALAGVAVIVRLAKKRND